MVDSDDITRRSIIRSGAAAVGATGLAGNASALVNADVETEDGVEARVGTDEETDVDVEDLETEQIPLLDVDDQVEVVAPTAFPETATGIRPGSQILVQRESGVAGCSANFVWRDAETDSLYLGTAGHCFLQDAPAASGIAEGEGDDVSDLTVLVCADCTFGGLTGQAVIGGEVIELGDVVYARQEEPGGGEGVGHDFGLVEIPDDARSLVDPSMPQFGGPTGTVEGTVPSGDPVVQYGAGVVNGELYVTQGSRGLSLGSDSDNSWYSLIRASPGDSGSALSAATDAQTFEGGPAAGVLTHITSSGTAGTTVDRCKDMVEQDGLDLDLEVVQP